MIVALSLALAATGMTADGAVSCAYDRAAMLALDQQAFDQDMDGGWRELAARPGCTLIAADLIRDYREIHQSDPGILYWHEGQLRASEGQAERAIALFEQSRKTGDTFGWNLYVDASIAFLREDRPALEAARDALARLPRPADFAPRDSRGRPIEINWPPNLHVVDRFIACFGYGYREAYAGRCEAPPPVRDD